MRKIKKSLWNRLKPQIILGFQEYISTLLNVNKLMSYQLKRTCNTKKRNMQLSFLSFSSSYYHLSPYCNNKTGPVCTMKRPTAEAGYQGKPSHPA